jgi:hypothetical protein
MLEQLPERFEATSGGPDADHRDKAVLSLGAFGALRRRAGLAARLSRIFLPRRPCALDGLVRRRVISDWLPLPLRWRVLFFSFTPPRFFAVIYSIMDQ